MVIGAEHMSVNGENGRLEDYGKSPLAETTGSEARYPRNTQELVETTRFLGKVITRETGLSMEPVPSHTLQDLSEIRMHYRRRQAQVDALLLGLPAELIGAYTEEIESVVGAILRPRLRRNGVLPGNVIKTNLNPDPNGPREVVEVIPEQNLVHLRPMGSTTNEIVRAANLLGAELSTDVIFSFNFHGHMQKVENGIKSPEDSN
jgi:hypothetical protein